MNLTGQEQRKEPGQELSLQTAVVVTAVAASTVSLAGVLAPAGGRTSWVPAAAGAVAAAAVWSSMRARRQTDRNRASRGWAGGWAGGLAAAVVIVAGGLTAPGVLDVEASGPAYEKLDDGTVAPSVDVAGSYMTSVVLDRSRSSVVVEISPAEGGPPEHLIVWEMTSSAGEVRTGTASAAGAARFDVKVPYDPEGASECTVQVMFTPRPSSGTAPEEADKPAADSRSLQITFPCRTAG